MLSLRSIAWKNLRRRWVRTMCMVLFILLLSASAFVCTIIIKSLEFSVNQTADRLGADLVVVPEEYESDYTDALFSGEPCSFYMDRMWLDEVSQVKGVEAVTPQLYLATLAASCCASELELVAYEPQSDFIITPWLEEQDIPAPKTLEAVVGDAIIAQVGEQLTFFGVNLNVVGRLERTGTGYDTQVFICFDTARELLQKEQLQSITPDEMDSETMISSLMVRLASGTDGNSTARSINFGLDGPIKACTANGLVSHVAGTMQSFTTFSRVLNLLVLIMGVLSILFIFTITIFERRQEFGSLFTVGATRGQLAGIILWEALIIGLIGGGLGDLIAGGGIYLFHDSILIALGIPSLVSGTGLYVSVALTSIALAVGTGLLASLYALYSVCRAQPLYLIQGESR